MPWATQAPSAAPNQNSRPGHWLRTNWPAQTTMTTTAQTTPA